MTAMRVGAAVFREDDPDTGLPLAGGKVYFYEEGTTTLKTTWADVYKNAANTNPVILDASGRAEVFIDGRYSIKVTKSDDTLVYTSTVRSPDETPDVTEALVNAVLIMPVYRTQAALAAAEVPATAKRVRVLGYADEKDYGGAEFVRVSSVPAHLLRVRSTDRYLPSGVEDATNGGWWAIGHQIYSPLVAGAVGDGVTNDAAAIDAVNDANAPAEIVDLYGRDYEYGGTFVAAVTLTNGRIIDDATTHNFFPARTFDGIGADAQGDIDPSDATLVTPTTSAQFYINVAGAFRRASYTDIAGLIAAVKSFDGILPDAAGDLDPSDAAFTTGKTSLDFYVDDGGAFRQLTWANLLDLIEANIELGTGEGGTVTGLPGNLVELSGSGSWTVPSLVTKVMATMVGGGGGSSDTSTGVQGDAGGDTTFGAQTATGGNGGSATSSPSISAPFAWASSNAGRGGTSSHPGYGGQIIRKLITVTPGASIAYSVGVGGGRNGVPGVTGSGANGTIILEF